MPSSQSHFHIFKDKNGNDQSYNILILLFQLYEFNDIC